MTARLMFGMESEAYHATEALGSSGLKLLRKSPLHFYGQHMDPERPRREPTPAMKAGTLAHCAILEPDTLAERYVVRPDGLDGRTKEGKAWLASVAPGVESITAEQLLTAQRQADAVRALPEIGDLLGKGMAEVSAFWTDETTGMECKCRPDWNVPVEHRKAIILDIKTAIDASPEGFARAVWNWQYHLQAAWYSDGYALAAEVEVLSFVFVVVESEYPHAAAAYVLDEETMAIARAENRRLFDIYAKCKRTNEWPGYPAGVGVLSLPAWARTTTPQE
jgi:exodeoxyribonuclease VIII